MCLKNELKHFQTTNIRTSKWTLLKMLSNKYEHFRCKSMLDIKKTTKHWNNFKYTWLKLHVSHNQKKVKIVFYVILWLFKTKY
jgi:hypothetical protein